VCNVICVICLCGYVWRFVIVISELWRALEES
jgi:hypothetical protein